MNHVYERCTRAETGKCSGCREDSGMDCRYESLAMCKVCGGMEGSLLPECPGRWLTREEDQVNYQHYLSKTGPFADGWEKLNDGVMGSERLQVPGGWVIRSHSSSFNGGLSVHQVFIPDPNHAWQVKAPPVAGVGGAGGTTTIGGIKP